MAARSSSRRSGATAPSPSARRRPAAARLDVGQNLDGGGRGGRQGVMRSESARAGCASGEDDPHERAARAAPTAEGAEATAARRWWSTWMPAWTSARQRRTPGQDDEQRVGLAGDQRQDDSDVEQDRQLELVVEGVGDLRRARSGQACWPSATSPHRAPRRRLSAPTRTRPIQNSRTKVSATCDEEREREWPSTVDRMPHGRVG